MTTTPPDWNDPDADHRSEQSYDLAPATFETSPTRRVGDHVVAAGRRYRVLDQVETRPAYHRPRPSLASYDDDLVELLAPGDVLVWSPATIEVEARSVTVPAELGAEPHQMRGDIVAVYWAEVARDELRPEGQRTERNEDAGRDPRHRLRTFTAPDGGWPTLPSTSAVVADFLSAPNAGWSVVTLPTGEPTGRPPIEVDPDDVEAVFDLTGVDPETFDLAVKRGGGRPSKSEREALDFVALRLASLPPRRGLTKLLCQAYGTNRVQLQRLRARADELGLTVTETP